MFSQTVKCNDQLMGNLSVYFVNATSLAKPNAIQLLSTDIRSNSIHVALVAETWFDYKVTDDLVSIDNYTLFRLDRNPKQKRKGVASAFMSKTMLSAELLNIVIQVSPILNTCLSVVSLPLIHML